MNIKIVFAETFGALLILILLARTLSPRGITDLVSNIAVLIIATGIVYLLIKSTRREVEQSEKLEFLTKELRRANEELKKLDAVKSEFISIASHQLRAPLTVIKGYVSMLLEDSLGQVTDLAKESMRKVFISSERLVKLIADMLDLSRIEAGQLKYDFKPIMLDDVVCEAMKEFEITAKQKRLNFHFENENRNRRPIYGDPHKLYEVIINLIDNAIKYTASGRISVRLHPESKESRDWLVLSVQDSGIGIKSADISKMFTKFVRTEEVKLLRPDGMGLGLYLVKKVVEDHGGSVRVESPGIGYGSTFTVALPFLDHG